MTQGTAPGFDGAREPLAQPTPRMPVMFIGHGSPMNVIEDTPWRRAWQALGQELLDRGLRPQLIVCISAHWLTESEWALTAMPRPRTIHDFGGFPPALYAQQYPVPGAPGAARALAAELRSPVDGSALLLDENWGLDHGAWCILKPMFPGADIPVVQLSMPYPAPPALHFALGRQLRAWRERGVLIVGSGNVVHNLRAVRFDMQGGYDWAERFDAQVQQRWASGDLGDLANFLDWGPQARLAHPTHDHFLPLLYAAGAVYEGEAPRVFNEGLQYGGISMRSAVWGMPG
jgi:4,5-DOPA dioxygenase extradiol